MGNSLIRRERVATLCKGKAGLVVLSLCVAFILVFVGIFSSNQTSPLNNLECFNCHLSSSDRTFLIEVEVELSDGMDQSEAINVATCALNCIQAVNSREKRGPVESSADLDSKGLWTVKVQCSYYITTWIPGHWGVMGTGISLRTFEALIDPINRTVECSLTAIEHH